jgi:hypothetical protein
MPCGYPVGGEGHSPNNLAAFFPAQVQRPAMSVRSVSAHDVLSTFCIRAMFKKLLWNVHSELITSRDSDHMRPKECSSKGLFLRRL